MARHICEDLDHTCLWTWKKKSCYNSNLAPRITAVVVAVDDDAEKQHCIQLMIDGLIPLVLELLHICLWLCFFPSQIQECVRSSECVCVCGLFFSETLKGCLLRPGENHPSCNSRHRTFPLHITSVVRLWRQLWAVWGPASSFFSLLQFYCSLLD